MEKGKICNICFVRVSVYEKVRHCQRCHSIYCKENYDAMKERKRRQSPAPAEHKSKAEIEYDKWLEKTMQEMADIAPDGSEEILDRKR